MTDEITVERKHSDEELKQIAIDLHGGRIFCDRQCNTPEEIGMVFISLNFMDEKTTAEFKQKQPAIIYEYLSEAGPRSYNGLPCFYSMRFLNAADFEVMYGFYQKLVKAVESL
jgi:hypothetical protein